MNIDPHVLWALFKPDGETHLLMLLERPGRLPRVLYHCCLLESMKTNRSNFHLYGAERKDINEIISPVSVEA